MKFTFTSQTVGFGSPKNTLEFECDQIGDVLNYFKQFLQGSGYVIGQNEELELVDRTWEFNEINVSTDYLNIGEAGGCSYDFASDITITTDEVPVEYVWTEKDK